MVTLNDYLYSGDTILTILNKFAAALRANSLQTGSKIDATHCAYVVQQIQLLEHNEFLTDQATRIREFYHFIVKEFPYFAFTFKGRIKSVIRAEEKFNGFLLEDTIRHYEQYHCFPPEDRQKEILAHFKDLVAYRIVVSIPKNRLPNRESRQEAELGYLYELAEKLPGFLANYGFSAEPSFAEEFLLSSRLSDAVRPYYRDFVEKPNAVGYQSLHINLYDNRAHCHIEIQLRTKAMDDWAEIGPANHLGYEHTQETSRSTRGNLPIGACPYFDEAYDRVQLLQTLDLSKVDVDMFGAVSNTLVNDGCGLVRGRLISPFEHLSRFQTG